MPQLVEHGACNARFVGLIPAGTIHSKTYARMTELLWIKVSAKFEIIIYHDYEIVFPPPPVKCQTKLLNNLYSANPATTAWCNMKGKARLSLHIRTVC